MAAPSLAQRPNYKLFTDPDRRFSVEFPQDWDWMNVSPAGESLAVFIHPRKEAAVVVERERLKVKPEVITETFAEGEALRLKASQPRATAVISKLVTEQGRRLVMIDYNRPGIEGIQERVRQYSFPIGQDVYRITSTAISKVFPKYEPIFATVAASLKPGSELPPVK